jgi:hypothetical protein
MSDAQGRFINIADYAIAVGLFGIIATLNFILFVEAAGSRTLFQCVYGALSIVLDGTEIVLWIRGVRSRNAVFMAIALSIAGVSLFSSTGAALLIASADDGRRTEVATTFLDADNVVKEAQLNVQTWTDRLAAVPADYTTQLREVGDRLAEARRDLQLARNARQTTQRTSVTNTTATASPIFAVFGARLRVAESTVKLIFLMTVSVLLQSGALATTYHANKETSDMTKKQRQRRQPLWWIDQQATMHLDNGGGGVVCGKPMRYMSAPNAKLIYPVCTICAKKGVVG